MLTSVVARFVERHQLLGERLVIGVSGGADSLALLYAFWQLEGTPRLGLHVAHFDHQLRGGSAADAEFVRRIADDLSLPITVGRGDVRQLAVTSGIGLEEAARNARYAFFRSVVDATVSSCVAVAHTRDDQTETRLLHLIRGSGLAGLRGMSEVVTLDLSDGGELKVARPFLDVTRAEIEAFCAERGREPRRDPSNRERRFSRNRVRLDLLPTFRSLNPEFDESLARLARIACDANEFLDAELDRRLTGLVERTPARWTIDRQAWQVLPRALKRQLLRRAALAIGPSTDVGAAAIERGLAAADSPNSGRSVCWPGGRQIRVDYDRFSIGFEQPAREPHPELRLDLADGTRLELPALPSTLGRILPPGASWTEGVDLTVRHARLACANRARDRWHADFDRATLGSGETLTVRARRPGDWLNPEGMAGKKKVQDVFVDAHIPRDERDRLPILQSESGIAWIVGLRRDRRFVAGSGCHDVICVEATPRRNGG